MARAFSKKKGFIQGRIPSTDRTFIIVHFRAPTHPHHQLHRPLATPLHQRNPQDQHCSPRQAGSSLPRRREIAGRHALGHSLRALPIALLPFVCASNFQIRCCSPPSFSLRTTAPQHCARAFVIPVTETASPAGRPARLSLVPQSHPKSSAPGTDALPTPCQSR